MRPGNIPYQEEAMQFLRLWQFCQDEIIRLAEEKAAYSFLIFKFSTAAPFKIY
jgi:hypothetical protein